MYYIIVYLAIPTDRDQESEGEAAMEIETVGEKSLPMEAETVTDIEAV